MKSRIVFTSDLTHHGIHGQKWGVRHGPPYPLEGGKVSKEKSKKIYDYDRHRNILDRRFSKKRYEDAVLKSGSKVTTLSFDPNRTKNVDMFYATTNRGDQMQYRALFDTPISDAGKKIYKLSINNKLVNDVKVASEKSGASIFENLYKNDRDFYNFVTDPKRMQSYFVDDKYKFKGYQESRDALNNIRNGSTSVSDVFKTYRMFNYVIPYTGDDFGAKDVASQRKKFFSKCKESGYGAILDTNDAMYGGFHAKQPVIMIDMNSIIPDSITRTSAKDVNWARGEFAVRRILGV